MEKLFEKPKVMIFEARGLNFDESRNKGLVIPFVTEVYGFFIEKSEEKFKTFYLDEMYRVINPKMMWSQPCGELVPFLKYEKGEKIDYKDFLRICNRFGNNFISTIDDRGRINYAERDDYYTYNSLIDSGLVIEKFPDSESNVEIYINEKKEDGKDYYSMELKIKFKLSSIRDYNYIVMKGTYQNLKRLKDKNEISSVSDLISRELFNGRRLFSNQNVSLNLKKEAIHISSSLSKKSIECVKDGIMELVEL